MKLKTDSSEASSQAVMLANGLTDEVEEFTYPGSGKCSNYYRRH